jgi:Na+-translocating ferredoxin:NAD+ oxidoreductase RnfC subunit
MNGHDAAIVALVAGTAATVLAGRNADEIDALMCDGCGDCAAKPAVCPAGIVAIDILVTAVRDRSPQRFAAAGGLTCIRCGRCEPLCPQRVPIASAVAPLQREWKQRIDADARIASDLNRSGLLSLTALDGLGEGPTRTAVGGGAA